MAGNRVEESGGVGEEKKDSLLGPCTPDLFRAFTMYELV